MNSIDKSYCPMPQTYTNCFNRHNLNTGYYAGFYPLLVPLFSYYPPATFVRSSVPLSRIYRREWQGLRMAEVGDGEDWAGGSIPMPAGRHVASVPQAQARERRPLLRGGCLDDCQTAQDRSNALPCVWRNVEGYWRWCESRARQTTRRPSPRGCGHVGASASGLGPRRRSFNRVKWSLTAARAAG